MAEKSVIQIQQENNELVQENKSLKEMLAHTIKQLDSFRGVQKVQRVNITPEEKIIEEQIGYLEAASLTRPLDLDETRTLDLLIKNKRLMVPEKPIEPEWSKITDNEDELLRIAGSAELKTKTGSKDPVA